MVNPVGGDKNHASQTQIPLFCWPVGQLNGNAAFAMAAIARCRCPLRVSEHGDWVPCKNREIGVAILQNGSRFQKLMHGVWVWPFHNASNDVLWLLNHIPAAGKHTSLRCESDPIKSECNNFRFCMDFQNLGSRASPGKDWLKVQGMRIAVKTERSRIVEGVDFQWLFLPFIPICFLNPLIINSHNMFFFCQSTIKEGSEWTAPSRNIYYDSFTAEVGELGYGGTLSECELRSEAEPQSPGFAFGTSSDCTVTWRNIFVSNHGKPKRKSIKLKVKNMQIQHFERWLKGVDKVGFSVTLRCFTRGFPKVYMNNGQTPSSFQAGIGWMGIFREIFGCRVDAIWMVRFQALELWTAIMAMVKSSRLAWLLSLLLLDVYCWLFWLWSFWMSNCERV